MKTKLLSMSRRLWNASHVPPEVNRRNQKKWAEAVARLGDRWLLQKHIERLAASRD